MTQSANFYYDETSVALGGNNYTMSNTRGRLSHTVAGGGVYTVLSYDVMGRAQSYWDCIAGGFCTNFGLGGGRTDYTYDLAGDLATENYTSGLIYTYKLNSAQQVAEVDSSLSDDWHPNPLVTAVTYTPFGAIQSLTAGRGYPYYYNAVETYDYNTRLQPWRIQLGTAQSTPNAYNCLVYNYYGQNATTCASTPPGGSGGNNGNVMGYYEQDNGNPGMTHTATYLYDSLNRLTTGFTPPHQNYTLYYYPDRYGNNRCSGGSGYCPNWSFNTATNQINTTGFTYDAAGNLTADGTHTYSWDAEGRLLSVDSGTEAYAYNVLGQRVQKRVNGVYTNSAHDAFGRLIYHDTGTSQSQIFQWLGSKMIGYYTTWERYAHTNALGSVAALTDVNGNLYQDTVYDPWGRFWEYSGTMEEYQFAGMQDRDTETGLDPTPNRMFSGQFGRWLSPDPLAGDITNPQSLNRYAYALNNPTTNTDPTGLSCEDPNDGQPCVVNVTAEDPNGNSTVDCSLMDGYNCGYGPLTGANDLPCYNGSGQQIACSQIGPPQQVNVVGKPSLLAKITNAVCSAIPKGFTAGVGGSGSFVGGPTGTAEVVVNFSTGYVSGFVSGGAQAGANLGGPGYSLFGGLIFGDLKGNNSGYKGGFTNLSASAFGGQVTLSASSGGLAAGPSGLRPNGNVFALSGGASTTLLPLPGITLSATNYSSPLQLGRLPAASFLGPYLLSELAEAVCQ